MSCLGNLSLRQLLIMVPGASCTGIGQEKLYKGLRAANHTAELNANIFDLKLYSSIKSRISLTFHFSRKPGKKVPCAHLGDRRCSSTILPYGQTLDHQAQGLKSRLGNPSLQLFSYFLPIPETTTTPVSSWPTLDFFIELDGELRSKT